MANDYPIVEWQLTYADAPKLRRLAELLAGNEDRVLTIEYALFDDGHHALLIDMAQLDHFTRPGDSLGGYEGQREDDGIQLTGTWCYEWGSAMDGIVRRAFGLPEPPRPNW